MERRSSLSGVLGVVCLLLAGSFITASGQNADKPVIPNLPMPPPASDSTVPANGDLNPYGVAFVPAEFPVGGLLNPGDIIVSNFNNNVPPSGLQGTGTTIVRVNANSAPSLFFTSTSPAVGLSTALGVLKRGFVIVGNLPSTDGTGVCTAESGPGQNVGPGSLQIIDRNGNVVLTLTDAAMLNGPWDLTIKDEGPRALVFVANALSGTVTRLELRILGDGDQDDRVTVGQETQIASGYLHGCNQSAFVVGPTGLALDGETDTLFVSSTDDNAIFAIPQASSRDSDAGTGKFFVQDNNHLHGPLALALAPNGDLISSQGDAINPDPNHVSEIVEFNKHGEFVAEFSIDQASGSAFGLAIRRFKDGFIFAAVDDGINVLDVWEVR